MDNAEAIKRINDHIRVHHIGEYPHIKIAEALNMAISALANDNNVGSKWIPVTERFPEELPKDGSAWSERVRPSVDVLVKIKGLNQLCTAWYSYSYKEWIDTREEYSFHGVTHWMTLPEPPKEE